MKWDMEEWVDRVEEEREGEESDAGVLPESEWEREEGVEEAGVDRGN
jgi:hypothetical protein